eukprot:4604394-Pleurochrysis_carterae.AAC.7
MRRVLAVRVAHLGCEDARRRVGQRLLLVQAARPLQHTARRNGKFGACAPRSSGGALKNVCALKPVEWAQNGRE